MSTNLEKLEMRLGVDWLHLRTARELAASKRLELRQALEHLDSQDTSIVVSDLWPVMSSPMAAMLIGRFLLTARLIQVTTLSPRR